MNPWKLTYKEFDPEQAALREALLTLGNGYLGTRGAAHEMSASKVHYPGTYIAGVWNTIPTEIAGRTIYNEDFVNCPNWLMFIYRIDEGPWANRLNMKILSYKIELNMQKGMLSRRVRWKDNEGRITLEEMHRIVSMAHPHCGAQKVTITPENYKGQITVRSGIDGLIINAGVERYRQLNSTHLIPADHGSFGDDGIFLTMKTSQSNIEITEAMRNLVYCGHERLKVKTDIVAHGRQRVIHEMTFPVEAGKRYSVDKLVSIYSSRDQGVTDSRSVAQETVGQVESFDQLFKSHQAKWRALWRRFDIEIDGDPFVQLTLRLHAFHLLQSASTYNEDIDAGMPVRGLHGEAYRGHVFWDELYTFPFYNLRAPEITRALLMYRYRRLGAAKENAKANGYKGAMYPWQQASTGEEVTQIIHLNPMSNTWGPDYSSLQRHVGIAIAYNIWTYFYTTGDRDFLDRYGAEMIVEIAHFWGSIAQWNPKTKRFDIDGVMGPDEFHEKYPQANKGGLKNNAYTNVGAVWVLKKALHILNDLMEEEDRSALLVKAGIDQEELNRWQLMTQKMAVPMDKTGLIHQFEGYMDLEELDWEGYRGRYDNIRRIDRILKSEGLSPDSYKASKQADVLMMFYIFNMQELQDIFGGLGYAMDKKILKKNFEYYFPRTSHGSTLSMVVHAYVADLLGDKSKAMHAFMEALRSDIYDTQGGTTQEGIHSGVMGSSIDLFLRCFAGLQILEDRVSLSPRLPEQWSRIRFNVRYKNIWFQVQASRDTLTITAEPLKEMYLQPTTKIPITVKRKLQHLLPGKPHTISTRMLFVL